MSAMRCGAFVAMGAIGAWLAPLPAAAEMLYKCVDPAGLTIIQQEPCKKPATQVWARDSSPEPPPTPEQIAAAEARARAQAEERARAEAQARQRAADEAREQAGLAPQAGTDLPPPPPPVDSTQCAEGKRFVAKLRAMPFLELTPAQMQRLYGWLAQQCK